LRRRQPQDHVAAALAGTAQMMQLVHDVRLKLDVEFLARSLFQFQANQVTRIDVDPYVVAQASVVPDSNLLLDNPGKDVDVSLHQRKPIPHIVRIRKSVFNDRPGDLRNHSNLPSVSHERDEVAVVLIGR
jgi:hypothetical protein